jgi:Putative transposase DNA-binding domain
MRSISSRYVARLLEMWGQGAQDLATREHRCIGCGLVVHRDHNAAINIEKLGALASGWFPMGNRVNRESPTKRRFGRLVGGVST